MVSFDRRCFWGSYVIVEAPKVTGARGIDVGVFNVALDAITRPMVARGDNTRQLLMIRFVPIELQVVQFRLHGWFVVLGGRDARGGCRQLVNG